MEIVIIGATSWVVGYMATHVWFRKHKTTGRHRA